MEAWGSKTFVTETGTDTGMISGDRFVPLDFCFCPELPLSPSSCDRKINKIKYVNVSIVLIFMF